ncbi:MAG: hypothetical protein ABII12_12305 [Planctomycetota bacterium]
MEERLRERAFIDPVISELRDDAELSEPLRRAALRHALWHEQTLCNVHVDVWEVVKRDDHTMDEYRDASRMARLICHHEANYHVYQTTLGMALYRVGDYEQALAVFERSRELAREPDPYNHAYAALAHHHLGQAEAARAALTRLRDIVAVPPYRLYGGLQDLLQRVETLIDPGVESDDADQEIEP